MTAGGPQQQNIIDRNANVITRIMNPTMANTFPSQVVFGAELDMFTAFGGTMPTAALYVDELHPSQMGYDLMGDILFDALTGANRPAILQRCP